MSRRKPVYVLLQGERCEGSSILGVYDSIESAQIAALEAWHDYRSGPKGALPVWTAEDDGKADIAWLNDVDYLSIERHEVRS